MEKTDKLIKQGSLFVIVSIMGNLFNFVFNIVMIRYLGPDDYGIFVTLLSVLAILGVCGSVIMMTVARYVALYSAQNLIDKIRNLLRVSIGLTASIGLIGFVIIIGAHKFILQQLNIPISLSSSMTIIALLFAFGLILPVLRGALQGLQRFQMLALNGFVDEITRLGSGILLVYCGYRIFGALGASLITLIVGFILSTFPIVYYLKKPEQTLRENHYKEILLYALPVLLYLYGTTLFARLDILVISKYIPEMRGYYTVAAQVGTVFWATTSAIITVMFPKVVHTHTKKENPLPLIHKSLLFSGLLCIIGILICFLFPAPGLVINKIFGRGYSVAIIIPLIRWFSVCVTPFAVASVLLNYHLARTNYEFIYLLIGGVILHGILLWLFHQTVYQVLSIIFISGILQIIANYWLLVYKENKVNKVNQEI